MKITQPIQIGKLTLKNRIVFPPLTTGYEERDGSIGERSFNFYKRLAEGGVGYIVLGDVAPVNTASPTPKLASDAQIESFQKLADACHEYGAKIALQLFHPEYDVPGVGKLIMASRMAAMKGDKAESDRIAKEAYAKLHHDMLHFVSEATKEQLGEIINAIGAAAKRAQTAGIDAIQVHGDRLCGSLCSKILNHRTDEYGGCFENRIRFAVEIVRSIKENAPELAIDYKLPVVTEMDGGLRGKGGVELEEAIELAKVLEKEGVDMLHVAQANHTGNMNDTIPAMGTREYGFAVYCADEIKKVVSIPVCAVGRIFTKEAAEALVASGKCDLVALGRPLVCDPDFAKKCESGLPIRACMSCNKGCTDAIQNRSFCQCVLNAENGAEYKRVIVPATEPKKVAIVGAGVAGLEAARVSALKGHYVTIFEKSYKLGGQINIASVPPRKNEMLRSVDFLSAEIARLGVTVKVGTVPTKEELNAFDEVIVAVGATNFTIPVEGSDGANVVSAWDVLAGKAIVFGKVAVIGGGLVGAETAEFIANQGAKVSIVEMMPEIAKGESSTVLPSMKADFEKHGVKQYVNTKLSKIEANQIVCEANGEMVQIEADFVVMAVGARKNVFDVEGIVVPVHYCGDCAERPADISNAIRTAYDVANAI